MRAASIARRAALALLAVSPLAFAATVAVPAERPLEPAWSRLVGPDRQLTRLTTALYCGSSGEIWLTGVSAPAGVLDSTPRLWALREDGGVAWERVLDGEVFARGYSPVSMAELAEDRILLLGLDGVDGYTLAVLDRKARVITRSPLPGGPSLATYRKLVPAADGGALLLGYSVDRGILARIGPGGEIAWQRELDLPGLVMLVDAVPAPDEGWFVIGNEGSCRPLEASECEVWIARLDGDGRLLHEVRVQGRHGSSAVDPAGALVVAYDRSNTPQQQRIAVRRMGSDLDLVAEREVLATDEQLAPETFELVALPGGGWLLAGSRANKPWVGRLGEDLALQDARWGREEQIAASYLTAAGKRNVYLISSGLEISSEGGERSVAKKLHVRALPLGRQD